MNEVWVGPLVWWWAPDASPYVEIWEDDEELLKNRQRNRQKTAIKIARKTARKPHKNR